MRYLLTFFALMGTMAAQLNAQTCQQPIDVVISMDSSGSIRGPQGTPEEYELWYQEIATAKNIIESHDIAEDKSKVAIINTSGSSSAYTHEECADPNNQQYRLKVEHAMSGDSASVNAHINGMDDSNFLNGYSWWASTFQLANEQFELHGRDNAHKFFVFMAEGLATVTSTADHKVCDETGYVSNHLQTMRNEGVQVIVIAMAATQQSLDGIACIPSDPSHLFTMDSFSTAYQQLVTEDNDNDGLCGGFDTCPNDPQNDYDQDSICGDVDTDDDNDGIADSQDTCPVGAIGDGVGHPLGDIDNDGCNDAEDTDIDNDGLLNDDDANPTIAITGLADNDKDGSPDSCLNVDCKGMAEDTDDDNDLIDDEDDAYPLIPITGFTDTDNDGAPDSCESDCLGMAADNDDDNDGVVDSEDAFPLDANESKDSDGDGIGDNQDPTPTPTPQPQPTPAPEEDTGSSSKSSGGFFDGLSLLILLTYSLFRRKILK